MEITLTKVSVETVFPAIHSEVYLSPEGVRYLKHPGVILVGQTMANITGMRPFLEGFDSALDFPAYVDDPITSVPFDDDPADPNKMSPPVSDGTHLCKTAGQTCYCSWGPGKRTMNKHATAYIRKILKDKHGSVLEHPSYSFFLYGIDRSITHELVRHRAGCAFSQVSQRYVDDTTLRFVMRPEYLGQEKLEARFLRNIAHAAQQYREITEELAVLQEGDEAGLLSGETKRERRKKQQQAAREVLTNSVEAPMTFTANARALRHIFEMRASEHAETQIRRLAMMMYRVVTQVEPIIFGDYQVIQLPDGSEALDTEFRKV